MLKTALMLSMIVFASIGHAAEVCIPGTISGQKDLATPWPLRDHGERHSQIQRAIATHASNVRFCSERYGDIQQPVQFSIPATGVIEVDRSTVQSPV